MRAWSGWGTGNFLVLIFLRVPPRSRDHAWREKAARAVFPTRIRHAYWVGACAWYGFDYKACIAAVNSAAGGLTVAAVLKYADAVLKGYATAISVLLTGVLSMVLFGTELSVEYALGMTNVLAAVFLYNAQDLEKHAW